MHDKQRIGVEFLTFSGKGSTTIAFLPFNLCEGFDVGTGLIIHLGNVGLGDQIKLEVSIHDQNFHRPLTDVFEFYQKC